MLIVSTSSAPAALVVPAGREAVVLDVVRAAWASSGDQGATKYDVRVESDLLRVKLNPIDVEVLVYAGDAGPDQLAPGVLLHCGTNGECSAAQRERWSSFAHALSAERQRARDKIWIEASTAPVAAAEVRAPAYEAWLRACVMLFGMVWLASYCLRALSARSWRSSAEPRSARGLLLTVTLLLVFVGVGLWGTAALPLHEHNSYVARNDCAWTPGCAQDPAGPAWVPAFFSAYRPLLHSFSYSVANTCRFSLALAVCVILLARHWLARALLHAGWSVESVRGSVLWATAFLCLNPICIRVAASGTPWPYVLMCLFGSGIACFEALGAETRARRALAGVAATCLLASAANSNLVMLTLLPLVWFGPSSYRRGARLRSWLPSGQQALGAAGLLALSYQSVQAFVDALAVGAKTHLGGSPYHTFFDYRLLPPSLGALLVVGLALSARRRGPLLGLVYVAVVSQPTLAGYAGQPLSATYPVGFINAYFGNVLGGVLAAVGAGWLLTQARQRGFALGRARVALCVALLAPTFLARESWEFLRGSRVMERELAQISPLLFQLPAHDLLLIPSRFQPPLAGAPRRGDPIEVWFPSGEYLAVQRRLGRVTRAPLPISAWDGRAQSERTLVYVGVSQRSFQDVEIAAALVPSSLERPELGQLKQRYTLEPVLTFELSPEQHSAIPWRLAAGRQGQTTLGFYWLRPLASPKRAP